jgi:hypothetical protein
MLYANTLELELAYPSSPQAGSPSKMSTLCRSANGTNHYMYSFSILDLSMYDVDHITHIMETNLETKVFGLS